MTVPLALQSDTQTRPSVNPLRFYSACVFSTRTKSRQSRASEKQGRTENIGAEQRTLEVQRFCWKARGALGFSPQLTGCGES
jgi:hypothetical protein